MGILMYAALGMLAVVIVNVYSIKRLFQTLIAATPTEQQVFRIQMRKRLNLPVVYQTN